MIQQTGNIIVFPPRGNHALAMTQDFPMESDLRGLDLLGILQTTLFTEQLLPLFYELTSPYLAMDGYEYKLPRLDIQLSGGRDCRYQASYNLLLDGDSIGEFIAKLQKPYTENELAKLEQCLALLVYPLRNTLLYQQALRDAHTDALTGVGNRAAFQSSLTREWKAARRQFAPLSLIAVDVDFFKRVNDTYGHPSGDKVLKTVARCVKDSTRGSDLVYRCGGEEFMALLSDTALNGAALLAERIRQHVADTPCVTDQGELKVTVSVGVATLAPGECESGLISRADQALYRAKREGRNRVIIAEDFEPTLVAMAETSRFQ